MTNDTELALLLKERLDLSRALTGAKHLSASEKRHFRRQLWVALDRRVCGHASEEETRTWLTEFRARVDRNNPGLA